MKDNCSIPRARAGVTLSEVLISTALLSLGIIGLAVLFPLSVLKSIQATQLTNATTLRYNAEAYLDTVSPSPLNTAPVDAPLTLPASRGDLLVLAVDPVGWLKYPTAGNQRHFVGNDGAGASAPNVCRRVPGIAVTTSTAVTTAETDVIRQLGTLPDSWINFYDGTGTVSSDTAATPPTGTFTFDTTVGLGDLGTFAATDPEYRRPRIVLFHTDGKRAERRYLVSYDATANSVTWNGPLPTGYQVARVRLETPDARYTWMMTVRKTLIKAAVPATVGPPPTPAEPAEYSNRIDVVVFFNRRFSPQDELVYSAPAAAGRPAFKIQDNTVELDYSATGELPFVKNGSFIFDARNGYWYRIIRYQDDASAQTLTIYLDRRALASSDSAILMRGIVEVFPIATKNS